VTGQDRDPRHARIPEAAEERHLRQHLRRRVNAYWDMLQAREFRQQQQASRRGDASAPRSAGG
jgi:hypothetical protein